MTTLVTIKATAPVVVISERLVDDGRERIENGRDPIAEGDEQTFIVHAGQSIRVIEAPVAAEQGEDA